MDSDDEDNAPFEPPLGPRVATRPPKEVVASSPASPLPVFNHHPDKPSNVFASAFTSQDRLSVDGYDSDRIDPDLEELLYTSVHHQTVDSIELSFDAAKLDNGRLAPSPCEASELPVSPSITVEMSPADSATTTLLNGCAMYNKRKTTKKELKRLKAAKEKATSAAEAAAQFKVERARKLDLSFGNLICGDELETTTTLDPFEAMNKFYNEDSYDSDEERASRKRMSSDRRLWKIGQEDLLANFGRRSGGSFRDRQKQCRQCGGHGHLVKECPRKLICYICGDTRHIGQKCRLRVCAICFQPGHLSHKCPVRYNMKEVICDICGQLGHSDEKCTQVWRKFLTVTDEATYLAHLNSNVVSGDRVTVNETVSCANCGERGKHFACECPLKTMDNMRFQMPPPVSNWRAIRRDQAKNNKRKDSLPKGRARGSISQWPSTSTSTATSARPPAVSTNHQLKPKSNKRPLRKALEQQVDSDSEPEVINISDSDSDDSVQYVLNLLKSSTQVNDSPITNGHKQRKGGKKDGSASSSQMNLNISSTSKKPKKPKKNRKGPVRAASNFSEGQLQSAKAQPASSKKKKKPKKKNQAGPSQTPDTPNGYQGHMAQPKMSNKKRKSKHYYKERHKREQRKTRNFHI